MPTPSTETVIQVDGRDAGAADLAPLAFAGFAHFTAMQIRKGRLRGLDLHLMRLRSASETLFGQALDDEVIRHRLRAAIGPSPTDLSLVATIFTHQGDYSGPQDEQLGVYVRTAPPQGGPTGPLRLTIVPHERPLPQIKQVAETPKTHYLRQARRQGFDDAAFVDREGRLSEATIWNLVFWDGETVVWPDAAILQGTTMSILQRRLHQLGVPQRTAAVLPDDLRSLAGAAVINSWTPGIAVTRIGTADIPDSPAFLERLHAAYDLEPPAAI